jgi:deoxyribodipyrimidine photo-lyase
MNYKRVRTLKSLPEKQGPVVYWMSRDQRANDNWALLSAQELALQKKQALSVVFCLVPKFLGATIRQYGFMLRGLQETAETLKRKNVAFYLLQGNPGEEIPRFVEKYGVSALVTDFDPLKIKQKWKKQVTSKIRIPFHEVDSHNIVPCWTASDKQEYGAYTLRPKIRRLLPEFLEEFSTQKKHPFAWKGKTAQPNWAKIRQNLKVNKTVSELQWIKPGEEAAHRALRDFIKRRLLAYPEDRNDPNKNGQSNLSPYLHFGQISAQRVALEAKKADVASESKDAFLEELIVRRELSDNFCFYNSNYDNPDGFPNWAKKTLREHKKDTREYIYSRKELENAKTHDNLWNAAQIEMVTRGKMHGYMRMYWAKKILQWTMSVEEAMDIAIYLNDKYELDGRDPNGYAGIAWSLGGLHDRAWNQRSVFGKIRYMSYNGCKSKFDVKAYISKLI